MRHHGTDGVRAGRRALQAIAGRWQSTSNAKKSAAVSRVRGTRDLLPDELEQHISVVRTLQDAVQRYGFRQIQTPLLEYTDLFCCSLGDGSDIVMKEMYTFEDNSGKSVTLRPEGTAGVVRALVSNSLMYSLPQKLSYTGSMFRYERPQRGRYREFQQFGAEYIGSAGPSVDVEVIAMAADALAALGIKENIRLEMNSLGDTESRARYRVALENYFEQYKCELSTDSQNRLERGSVLRILDSKSESDQQIVAEAPQLDQYLSEDAAARFDMVVGGLEALGIDYRLNSRLVRGLVILSCYAGLRIELLTNAFVEKNDDGSSGIAVLAGGCYDSLVDTLGGPATSCIGWAAGLDRLCLLRNQPSIGPSTISVCSALMVTVECAL
ncbi:TPA: hypothetical protein N0F65_011626 [Lagenidium giganteum]|uniref:histidine--tRNA ligase n=1 Tax=Lagenidium giganteum TaxID=4803 RepID=A0AAV2ZD36_9STRA|nr:TPA: hypothetical protein N0F65_011626 [Lagenidium giganteum]